MSNMQESVNILDSQSERLYRRQFAVKSVIQTYLLKLQLQWNHMIQYQQQRRNN